MTERSCDAATAIRAVEQAAKTAAMALTAKDKAQCLDDLCEKYGRAKPHGFSDAELEAAIAKGREAGEAEIENQLLARNRHNRSLSLSG